MAKDVAIGNWKYLTQQNISLINIENFKHIDKRTKTSTPSFASFLNVEKQCIGRRRTRARTRIILSRSVLFLFIFIVK